MPKNHAQIIDNINAAYDASYAQAENYADAVKFSQQGQYFRFEELLKGLDIAVRPSSILDIGCGNAELYKFLNFKGFRGTYTGVDINANLLRQAQTRFPGVDVLQCDIAKDALPQKYDYVLLNGIFNAHCGQDDDWVFQYLHAAFETTNVALACNFISTYTTFREDSMYYLSPEKAFTFCVTRLSRRITLAHHALPYNYTLHVFKEEAWSSV